MKLIYVEVNWMEDWANQPFLVIQVDKKPNLNDLRFQKKENFYFAHLDGYVNFFAHTPNNETGYGGNVFKLTLEDESDILLRGPWSSRAGVMNNHFEPHCVDVQFINDRGGRTAGSVTIDFAKKAAKMAGVELVPETYHGDLIYRIRKLPDET